MAYRIANNKEISGMKRKRKKISHETVTWKQGKCNFSRMNKKVT